uniref:protein enabled homolog isoform X2 n=1 Tax=Panthera onca TaxID=9690 RepID=UPI002954B89A|nr:protein enabled homolog isoform X2 [Panthera onca]
MGRETAAEATISQPGAPGAAEPMPLPPPPPPPLLPPLLRPGWRWVRATIAAAATAAVACAAETRLEIASTRARNGVRGCSRRQHLPARASRAARPSLPPPPPPLLLPALLRTGWRWTLQELEMG